MDLRKETLEARFPQTWEDVVAAEVGHVFVDEFEEGVRFLIMRGPVSLCAYVGIPPSHPLAGWDYDDLNVTCHGGLTYAGTGVHGDGETYWYGWDYTHSGDYSTYYDERPLSDFPRGRGEMKWTPAMVYSDSWEAVWDFKRAVKLAEKVARRGWQTAEREAESVA